MCGPKEVGACELCERLRKKIMSDPLYFPRSEEHLQGRHAHLLSAFTLGLGCENLPNGSHGKEAVHHLVRGLKTMPEFKKHSR